MCNERSERKRKNVTIFDEVKLKFIEIIIMQIFYIKIESL